MTRPPGRTSCSRAGLPSEYWSVVNVITPAAEVYVTAFILGRAFGREVFPTERSSTDAELASVYFTLVATTFKFVCVG